MGVSSSIQWTDGTWNIARGCTKVDADCKFCYMYRDSFDGTRYNPREVVKTKTVFNMPLKLKEPSKVFMSSLTDVFHPSVDSFRGEAWDIIRKCPQHTFQVLTKRPERILEHTPKDILAMKNVWMGTSVGSMAGVGRIEALAKVPSPIRFVSFEPLHEMLDLSGIDVSWLNWAIIGGESGNETGLYRYRPCDLEWMTSLVESLPKGCAVFVKQMGSFLSKQMGMSDRHGGNVEEFIPELRVREFPTY